MTIEAFDPTAGWPDPVPLPGLPAVEAFDAALLPTAFRPLATDIARRMQCPPEYVAVPLLVAAGAVIGRRIGIRPKLRDNWQEVPNLWGMIVGRPGILKSPAMTAALAPLRRLDAVASENNRRAAAEYKAASDRFTIAKGAAKEAAKKGDPSALDELREPLKPAERRYMTNDTSYEALGVIMSENPNGVLAYRDELISLLKPLGREDNAAARGFYLSAWNGRDSYTFDRIIRGRQHIEACCLSLLGATQPNKLASYLGDAVRGGDGDDGLAQRLGLLVWPDAPTEWRDVDVWPDPEARRTVNAVFDRLDDLDAGAIGAETVDFVSVPFLRFAPDALSVFQAFHAKLQARIRAGDLAPPLEAHLAKYPGLVAKLALLFHLIDDGRGPVCREAVLRAVAWAAYLESHAARAYASVTAPMATAAKAIWAKVKVRDLPTEFTLRDVHRRGWSGLTEHGVVKAGLDMLALHDWLSFEEQDTGGRRLGVYAVNPKAIRP